LSSFNKLALHEQELPAELVSTGQPPDAALEALQNMVLTTRYNGWRYIAVSHWCWLG
jgi:hypothetical protein